MAFTNSEKQARYRERHLGVDGEKVRVGTNERPVTLQSIAHSGRWKNFPLICRAAARTPAASHFKRAPVCSSVPGRRGCYHLAPHRSGRARFTHKMWCTTFYVNVAPVDMWRSKPKVAA